MQAPFQLVHGSIDMLVVHMCVSLHHRHRFMPADPFYGGQVDAGLDQVTDRCVP